MNRFVKQVEENSSAGQPITTTLLAVANGETTWAEVAGLTFENAKAIAQIGCDFASAGRLDEARIVFEGLVAMNPRDSAAHAALGTVYQKLGRIDEAVGEYSAAIVGDAKNPIALANRGEIRVKAGDREGLTDLTQAVEADPHGETPAGRRARGLVKAIASMAVKSVSSGKATRAR